MRMSKLFLVSAILGSTTATLYEVGLFDGSKAKASDTPAPVAHAEAMIVDPSARRALFGDLHLHTSYSFDAWGMGSSHLSPDDAYRFARGFPVNQNGKLVQRSEPLDFMAVTDHAEYMGVLNQFEDPRNPAYNAVGASAIRADHQGAFARFLGAMHRQEAKPLGVDPQRGMIDAWAATLAAARKNYVPGKFTTFAAYEWSATAGGVDNLHRNVIFAGDQPPLPFSSVDSRRPEDLWSYLERYRSSGQDVVAIPHNSNASNGLMFDWVDSDRHPISEAYAQRRAANEPLMEIYQTKGSSETHLEISPTDEFAGFEKWDVVLDFSKRSNPPGSYARDALGRGLIINKQTGANPFKFGFVGGSDLHTGLSEAAEQRSLGHSSYDPNVNPPSKAEANETLHLRGIPNMVSNGSKPIHFGIEFGGAGLTGVWAEQNTRPSIFAALRRRETFATSGTRLQLRFFGGWNYSSSTLSKSDWIKQAYATGVPMGSDLPSITSSKQAPTFLLWAAKDPDNANLDRVQIIKVWLDGDRYREKIFDAAWSGHRRLERSSGKLPAVGSTVDLKTASYRNSIGAAMLNGAWRDPEFNPNQPAVYYARVLEIPTPRWTTYLAVRNQLPIPADRPATIQERAWSSPIWYVPK